MKVRNFYFFIILGLAFMLLGCAEKSTPEVVIENVVPTQESVSFDIIVTDLDEIGLITSIELYKYEESVDALIDMSIREFTNLLSNTEYTIKVTYVYDLHDGNGVKKIVESYTFQTSY